MIRGCVPVNTRSAVKRTTIRTNIETASLFEALAAPLLQRAWVWQSATERLV